MSGASRSVLVVDADGSDATAEAVEARATERDGVDVERVSVPSRDAGTDTAGVDTADVDAVFAVGEASLFALAADPPACPVFVVDAGAGRYDASTAGVDAAIDAVATGAYETAPHPVLGVAVDGEPVGAALADVSLVTAEPARISEYGVASDGWSETVRADGIVVATPLGSEGYAHAVDGPLLAPETGLAAVPISPYAMHADTWVLQPPVSLSVERDEAAVSLLLDDAVARTVPAAVPISITVAETLSIAAPQTFGTATESDSGANAE
ncbi:NAD(+)/NADH kinase [Halobellus rubicundus]|uniref:NAD(+)/NADH kinase n=1 Tax=Halobellus rubicundus TaxID=2996466 RepID=A0ABD5MCZ7_9EURY